MFDAKTDDNIRFHDKHAIQLISLKQCVKLITNERFNKLYLTILLQISRISSSIKEMQMHLNEMLFATVKIYCKKQNKKNKKLVKWSRKSTVSQLPDNSNTEGVHKKANIVQRSFLDSFLRLEI
jgi:hypothetical protein